jgi:murein DD-endopeptidase MepM/ murein hydrolase activator NlpD
MRQLHKATALSLITASLVAAAAVLTPTLAKAEPPTVLSGADQISEPRADHPDHVSQPPTDDPLLESDTATPPASRQWRSPVGGLDLLTDFDPPPQRWLPGHRGVDLAASADLPVTAAGAGTYEPVEPLVAAGDAVTAGQTIGHLQPGHASCPNAACLHLGLKRGPLYLDPMLLFGSGKVRLLPRPGRAGQSAELNSERSIAAPAMTRGRAVHRTPQPNRSTAKPDDAIRTAPRAASRLPTGISIVHRSEARP